MAQIPPSLCRLPTVAASAVILLLILPSCQGAEQIKVMLAGQILDRNAQLPKFLSDEPLVDMVAIPARGDYVRGGMDSVMKYIRLYFPRTYEEMKRFDYILLTSPEYYLFTTQQDKWMHDVIEEGAGGFNDASVFSIVSQIHEAWAVSLTQLAFPNDAPAVVARGGGGESLYSHFTVRVNRDFPDPVLTPYIPYGIEEVGCSESRFLIPREGSGILAWQVGNIPGNEDVPYLVAWEYGEGRTMTIGDAMHKELGFFRYPKTSSDNVYAADILTNIILHSTGRSLIQDVEVFHRIKSYFIDFRAKKAVLVSLSDFIDKFGANTGQIQKAILEVEDTARLADDQYLNQEFVECEATMTQAFGDLQAANGLAKKLKSVALIWVYVIEWLATTATLLVSGYVLWTLMARRRLYRSVRTTKSIR